MANYDLSDFDVLTSNEGVWCDLVTPKGDPLLNCNGDRMRIKVVGTDSPKFKQVESKIQERKLKNKQLITSSEAQREDTIELLSNASVDWENFYKNGKPLEKFSTAEVANLYREYPFIKEQIDRYIGNRINFL